MLNAWFNNVRYFVILHAKYIRGRYVNCLCGAGGLYMLILNTTRGWRGLNCWPAWFIAPPSLTKIQSPEIIVPPTKLNLSVIRWFERVNTTRAVSGMLTTTCLTNMHLNYYFWFFLLGLP